MAITKEQTRVSVDEEFRDYFVKRRVLGGLVSWKETVRTDSLGTELRITTKADRVYINGTLVNPSHQDNPKEKVE